MKKLRNLIILLVVLMMTIIALPNYVFADGDVFDQLLTDGKLVIKSIEPQDEGQAYVLIDEYTLMNKGFGIAQDPETYRAMMNEDFTVITICKLDDPTLTREVEVVYDYDPAIKTVVDRIMAKLPEDAYKYFNLTDMEYIKYMIDTKDVVAESEEDEINIATYCGELKQFIGYKNFVIEPRMGDDGYFFTYKAGNATFNYKGTIYGFADLVGVYAKSVIYVDDDENDIENAIKTKLEQLFPNSQITVEKTETTIEGFLDGERQAFEAYYEENDWMSHGWPSKEAYSDEMMDLYYYNEDAACYFLNDAEEYTYGIQIDDAIMEFAVVKDSSKVSEIPTSLITNDASSDITISSNSKEIPLDTLISVAKLTSGEEYNKIMQVLEIANSEIYDLKLYSKTTGDYITRLPNGTFEVKIPISDKLKDKVLTVYYVNANDEVEEHEVTIENGYAVFTTNHFSAYTLAEKPVKEYTVKFNTNGGSEIKDVTVEENTKVAKPEDPTKEGFTFVGWFTDEKLETEFDFTKEIKDNVTIYAKWKEEEKEPEEYTLEEGNMTLTFEDEAGHKFEAKILDVLKMTDEERTGLGVTKEQYEEILAKIKEDTAKYGELLNVYVIEISAQDYGYTGETQLKIKLTDELKKYEKFKFIYIDDKNNFKIGDVIDAKVEGEYIIVTLPHLSVYAVLGEKAEQAEETTEEKKEETSNPGTGDNLVVFVALFFTAAIGEAVVLLRKHKKKE